MKEYMMILHGSEAEAAKQSPEEMQQRMGQWFAWTEKMQKSGIMIAGEALFPEARTITGPNRVVKNRMATEAKEIVGGFYIVKANSVDEVEKIAQDFPDFDLNGTVEIREIQKFEMP